MLDKPYDAGDPEDIQEQEKRRKQAQRYDEEAWGEVLHNPAGRYVINCVLEEMSKPFAASFNPDSARLTDFREGERNVGNKLIARAFGGKRQHYFTMMRDEHAKREERRTHGR